MAQPMLLEQIRSPLISILTEVPIHGTPANVFVDGTLLGSAPAAHLNLKVEMVGTLSNRQYTSAKSNTSARLSRKRPWNLTVNESQQCSHLNYGPGGSLQRQLRYYKKYRLNSWAYMIKTQEGKVLSWALAYQMPGSTRWEAQFWTRNGFRRQGLGSRIARAIQRDFEDSVRVLPHDDQSIKFFRIHRRKQPTRYGTSI